MQDSPRYLFCRSAKCSHRHFFGATFRKIVRNSPGASGWIFWRCNSCGAINSDRVCANDIARLSRRPGHGRIEEIYSPEFCQHLIELAYLRKHGLKISEEEAEELAAALSSSQLDDMAFELYCIMADVRLS